MDADVDQLLETCCTVVLHSIIDQLAPAHVIRRRPGRPTPSFDAECRALRRDCGRLERRYRRTRRSGDRRLWVQVTRHRFRLCRAKREHCTALIVRCGAAVRRHSFDVSVVFIVHSS